MNKSAIRWIRIINVAACISYFIMLSFLGIKFDDPLTIAGYGLLYIGISLLLDIIWGT